MSEQVKHTPGPWIVARQPVLENGMACCLEAAESPDDFCFVVDEGCGPKRICRVGSGNDFFTDQLNGDHAQQETNEANARLIATAPELLAACCEALECLTAYRARRPYAESTCERLEAAIAKAKGQ